MYVCRAYFSWLNERKNENDQLKWPIFGIDSSYSIMSGLCVFRVIFSLTRTKVTLASRKQFCLL